MPRGGGKRLLVVLGLALAFGLLHHLLAPGFHPVQWRADFARGDPATLEAGWTPGGMEPRVVAWQEPPGASLELPGLRPDPYVAIVRALPLNRFREGQILRITFNGEPLTDARLHRDDAWETIRLGIPMALVRPDRNRLGFENRSPRPSPIAMRPVTVQNFVARLPGPFPAFLAPRPASAPGPPLPSTLLVVAVTLLASGASAWAHARGTRVPARAGLPPLLLLLAVVGSVPPFFGFRIVLPTATMLGLVTAAVLLSQIGAVARRLPWRHVLNATRRLWSSWPLRLGVTAGALLALYGVTVWQYAARFEHDPTGLVVLGERFRAPHLLPESAVIRAEDGYDGQFYYYLAQDLLLRSPDLSYLDLPAYRYGRIGFPALVALVSLGHRDAIPLAMLGVNLLGLALGFLAVARLTRLVWPARPSVLPAVAFCLIPGLLLALLRSLAEPLASGIAAMGLLQFVAGRPVLGGVLLSGAALTRETALLFVVPPLAVAIVQRRAREAFGYTLPVTVYLAWQTVVYARLGTLSVLAAGHHVTELFAGIGTLAGNLVAGTTPVDFVLSAETQLAFLLGMLLLASVKVVRRLDGWTLGMASATSLLLVLHPAVWVEPWAWTRASVEASVWLILLWARDRDRPTAGVVGLLTLTFVACLRALFP